MDKNKEFRNKVLKRLYVIEEEKEKYNPDVKRFALDTQDDDEFVISNANQNMRVYSAERPPANNTESLSDDNRASEDNEMSSDSSQDKIQSCQRRRRRKRKANTQNEKTEQKITSPSSSTLTKNQKRKLKKKRRKEQIKEKSRGNLAPEFVYKPSTID